MCTVISIINNKGGVGKTTSTAVIAELLAYLNQKVLVIDLDQQSNVSMILGAYTEDTKEVQNNIEAPASLNVAEIFKYRYRKRDEVLQTIHSTKIAHLDIIPSSNRHRNTLLNIASNATGNNNIILKKAIATVKDSYDFILIDNAPANDALTVNSMFASDIVFVPVCVEEFSYKGLRETIDTILYIKEEHDLDQLQFGGAFITKAEGNTNSYRSGEQKFQEALGYKLFQTPIRKDVKMIEIAQKFHPVLEYCPDTNAVFDYANLILEMKILDATSTLLLQKSIGQA